MQHKCFTLDTVIFASSFLKTEEIKGKSGWWIGTELLVAGGDKLDNSTLTVVLITKRSTRSGRSSQAQRANLLYLSTYNIVRHSEKNTKYRCCLPYYL